MCWYHTEALGYILIPDKRQCSPSISFRYQAKCEVIVGFMRTTLVVLLVLFAGTCYAAEQDLKIVVTAAFVSDKGLPIYQDIADYLGKKVKRKARVVSDLSYDDSYTLLKQGVIHVGFVCGLPYIHAK